MKKLLPLTVCAWLLTAALCLAHSLPDTEAYVGGIGPGCTLGYVKSIYGEPTNAKRFTSDGVRVATYWYGDGFRVIGRVAVTDASLGAGSQRGSLLERILTIRNVEQSGGTSVGRRPGC